MRIMLAADEAIGPRVANLVSRSAHELVVVATPPSERETPRSLSAIARAQDIPCLNSLKLGSDELVEAVGAATPDVLLNVHSLTKVSPSILDLFPVGSWNLHPGPLPEGAGANVPSWAIALGWDTHGVTLHKMTADYDDGAIAFEDRFPITPEATGLTLSAECSRRGLGLIVSLLQGLEFDPSAVPSIQQDSTQRRYYPRHQPNEGRIDWADAAGRIEAFVRACDFRPFPSPWAPPTAAVDGRVVELLAVDVGDETHEAAGTVRAGNPCSVAAGDRWITLTEVREVTT